ncbi:MAG: hypothetical protein K8S99_12230 [Planctomycetes bacterium]|nr:hypothetical protein [Planctomycetota bacterium]
MSDRSRPFSVMGQCWPKMAGDDMNHETALAWKRAMHGHDDDTIIRALRGLMDTLKWAPKPSELREALRRHAKTTGGSGKPRVIVTQGHLDKAALQVAGVVKEQADAMSDADARVQRAEMDFRRATQTYGPASVSTVSFWQAWMRALVAAGVRTDPVETRSHTAEAREQFIRDGGEASAKRIFEAHRNKTGATAGALA